MTSRIVREQIGDGADLGTGEGSILLVTDTAQARDGDLVESRRVVSGSPSGTPCPPGGLLEPEVVG